MGAAEVRQAAEVPARTPPSPGIPPSGPNFVAYGREIRPSAAVPGVGGGVGGAGVVADVTRGRRSGAVALVAIVAVVVVRGWVGGVGSDSNGGGEAGSTPAGRAVSARVVRVIDGDTTGVATSGGGGVV